MLTLWILNLQFYKKKTSRARLILALNKGIYRGCRQPPLHMYALIPMYKLAVNVIFRNKEQKKKNFVDKPYIYYTAIKRKRRYFIFLLPRPNYKLAKSKTNKHIKRDDEILH